MIKQALGFVALFGLGLGVLFWLDSRQSSKGPGIDLGPLEEPPPPEALGEAAPGITMIPRGRFSLVQYAEGQAGSAGRSIEFTAGDSGPGEDRRVLLEDLTIRMFDPETDALVVEILADRGSTELEEPGKDVSEVSLSSLVELSGVTVKLLRGSRLVPLVLTSDELSGDLSRGRFVTPGRADIAGSGISAQGHGLTLDESQGLIAFERDANTVVRAEGGQPSRLACAGALEIRQGPGSGARTIRIEAQDRALLAVEGVTPLTLQAGRIEIDGRLEEQDSGPADGGFRFEKLGARGDVELRADGHSFRSQGAEFELSEAGQLQHAKLVGSPLGKLRLPESQAGPVVVGGQVELWGEGPLRVDWGATPTFQMAGPAELRWRGASLWASGGLAARPPVGAGSEAGTEFRAWTGVELDFEGWQVRTENLEGRLFELGDTGRLELETQGHSRIEGRTEAGETLDLLARGGFDFHAEGQTWLVPEAREVAFNLNNPSGTSSLSGQALRLFDFDAERRSFRASGEVEVHSGPDYLTGESVEVLGVEDFTLIGRPAGEGLPAVPVRFESRFGSIVAMQVERRMDSIEGRGAVHALFAGPQLTLDLDCEALSLSGRGLLSLEGDGPHEDRWSAPVLLLARGDVRAKADSQERNFLIRSGTLRLLRTPLVDSREFRSDLQARGAVDVSFKDAMGHFKLLAAEFDALFFDPFERPEDTAADSWRSEGRGNLAARGDVQLEKVDSPPLTGRGDRFELDHQSRGRLSAREGGQVSTAGYLPGNGEPFTLRAREFSFEPQRLVADLPEIVIVGAEQRPAGQEGAFALKELEADARRLVATPEAIVFSEDVHFVAHTPEGKRWTLDSGEARFDRLDPTALQDGPFDHLEAAQRVRLAFSEGPTLSGDRLSANTLTGLVRVDGTPATARNEFLFSAQWIEIDTRNFLLRAGPGFMEQQPGKPAEAPPAPPGSDAKPPIAAQPPRGPRS
jgi:hypothetical protein